MTRTYFYVHREANRFNLCKKRLLSLLGEGPEHFRNNATNCYTLLAGVVEVKGAYCARRQNGDKGIGEGDDQNKTNEKDL